MHLLVRENGLAALLDLLPLAHLHVARAYVAAQQTNVIEAGEASNEEVKEWYYNDADGQRQGPLGLNEVWCKKSHSNE